MNAPLIKLLLPATLAVAFAGSAFAAEAAKPAPTATQPATHQAMKIKRARAEANLQQTAAEGRRQGDHNRINNDAGVPPSGVPSETMIG
ncbi:MAG: hypothetical protein JWN73_600 [Betaproteobacteria bacterium]|nr:hypothetical protein [Betaproteobacteria bacterium]